MSAIFEPIRVINLVTEKTEQSPTAFGLRLMYFQLSALPTQEWIQLFDNQRHIPKHRNMVGGREATIGGRFAVVDCAPDELEKQHELLKHDVSVTNNDYQEYLNKIEARALQDAQVRKAELEKIEGIKSRLKFD